MKFVAANSSRSAPDPTSILALGLLSVFMFLLVHQFSLAQQEVNLRLPGANLARPPAPSQTLSINVQLTDRKTVILGGTEVSFRDAPRLLKQEHDALEALARGPATATVLVRADRGTPTGRIQELVEMGQRAGFERFLLRPRQEGTGAAP